MEENSSAVEGIILFYINMKLILKTQQVVERAFMDEMIKYCRKNGFKYSNEEIKNTWENLVSKYRSLKYNGTLEEKENWKYFEILDSCYEHSDFYNGVYSKFSEEMVWFLIECFLKKKALKKTHKHSSIVNEIYKEFVRYDYLYITKQDIDNKWRHLNLKYEKEKNNPESLKKWPYLQALKGYHDDSGSHVVNMVFTRELTDILIERFTEKKVTCVIHGYDSDQVLSEIQSEFKDLGGFFFSKDAIKEKWKALTTVYKFLMVKGYKGTSWVYFHAMRNHFKDDFPFMWGKTNTKNEAKGKRLRQRSKSVGPELISKKSAAQNLVVQLEQVLPLDQLKTKDDDEIIPRKKKSTKRSSSEHRRIKSRKKLKIRRRTDTRQQDDVDPYQTTDTSENKIQSNEISSGNITFFHTNTHLQKSTFQDGQERRNSADLGSPTSKVHIINIDHSEIDRHSGNLTINLPSITKQFSDNEFLPLKKRLRTEGETVSVDSGNSKEVLDGFLGFPSTQAVTPKTEANDDKRLTEEEMVEIMERINKEDTRSCNVSSKSTPPTTNSTKYYGPDQFDNYQGMYSNQCFIVPKEEQQDNGMQNYSPSAVPQPPVLLLVIKVDSNNAARDSIPKVDESTSPMKDNTSVENNAKTETTNSLEDSPSKAEVLEKRTSDTDKQTSEQPQVSNNIVKAISPKGKTIIISNKKNLVPFKISDLETSTMPKSSKTVSDSVKINVCNSEHALTIGEQVTVNTTVLNKNMTSESSPTGDTCVAVGDETIRSSEEGSNKELQVKNEPRQTEEDAETVSVKNEIGAKLKIPDRTPVPVAENNVPSQAMKPPISTGKIRLPVKEGGGKMKDIFFSPDELNKIKLKPLYLKAKHNYLAKPAGATQQRNLLEKKAPGFKFISQVIKPARKENGGDKIASPGLDLNDVTSQPIEDNALLSEQPFKTGSRFLGLSTVIRTAKNEEFENESVMSEAIGDDEGLKDNLLATVIDFQEQNNQEFIEIKNLMKQNNLLQRETNRLLRLMLEKQ